MTGFLLMVIHVIADFNFLVYNNAFADYAEDWAGFPSVGAAQSSQQNNICILNIFLPLEGT
jgi:hypothetical protein